MPNQSLIRVFGCLCLLALFLGASDLALAKKKDGKKKNEVAVDPYAEYVWPPPPDEARIKLDAVLTGRGDVEARSKLQKSLLRSTPLSPFDALKKPFAVEFDAQGRIVVSDSALKAIVRFDREGKRYDVFGTQGAVTLASPLGLDISAAGHIFVADSVLKRVVAYTSDGSLKAVYGRDGELLNPTDAAVSPDETRLYVADSKAHQIVVYDTESASEVLRIGKRGEAGGEFAFPTSLAFDGEGNLFVVDQLNCRIQLLDPDGDFLDQFGSRGINWGQFDRPKDVAVDEVGFIYVADNALNNVQLFDVDFSLLTFIGAGGQGPGRFDGASGVAVRGDEFAVVDQLGRRVQVFRFIVPKDQ